MGESKPTYPEIERRQADGSALVTMVQQIHSNVVELRTEVTDGLSAIKTEAFPDGDADGHRRHHEAVIRAAEDRALFWRTLRVEVAKYGLIAVAGWLITITWQALNQGPHK